MATDRPSRPFLAPPRAHRVLIVEDESIVALDLQLTLEDMGYEVLGIAASADEAIEAIEAAAHVPDLVLMDIRIRGMRDGIETAMLLHERHGLPIVFLTAHSDPATIERAMLAEPYGYIAKPLDYASLRATLAVALQKHASIGRRLATLAASATHDELTGLLNRRGFTEAAARAVALAQRTGRPLAIAYVDVNGMKEINDRFGHAAGDRMLIATAELLRATFRTTDSLARLGGDEFAALAEEYLENDDGEALRQRFRRQMARRRSEITDVFALSASIGITIHNPRVPRTVTELLAEADARMYAAKQRRRLEGSQPIGRVL
jgi:diguanylate cyclase (GGDEF)-like protein